MIRKGRGRKRGRPVERKPQHPRGQPGGAAHAQRRTLKRLAVSPAARAERRACAFRLGGSRCRRSLGCCCRRRCQFRLLSEEEDPAPELLPPPPVETQPSPEPRSARSFTLRRPWPGTTTTSSSSSSSATAVSGCRRGGVGGAGEAGRGRRSLDLARCEGSGWGRGGSPHWWA